MTAGAGAAAAAAAVACLTDIMGVVDVHVVFVSMP